MQRSAAILSAMSNTKRLEVLIALLGREYHVTELAERVRLSQSALSQHLAKLRTAQLVSTRRDAQTIFYSVKSPVVRAVLDALAVSVEPSKIA